VPIKLSDVISFRGDRLFNGAVNINWFGSDEPKAEIASEAFVFHGPKYHGVRQQDVGTQHGHNLIDTASFARSVVRRCYGLEDYPFTLAIAGYGTGKSHLALTLASLVSNPDSGNACKILSSIGAADDEIASDINVIFQESSKPCLAVTLNGMQGFDLAAEFTKQIIRTLNKAGHDSKPFDDLRPRFGQAATLVRMSNQDVREDLLKSCEYDSIDELLRELEQQDESAYLKVHEFFAALGMPIRALSGESVRDVIDIAVREYCGLDKPYRSLLVLFDEFGKYMEFATVRSQIAGNGVLQDLFEAIQANANNACFVGFIQFELNSYVQRIAPEYKNEILRYVTRYQSANRLYLSINLETLIASLIEKRQGAYLDARFDNLQAREETNKYISDIGRWFPQSRNHSLWGDAGQFHSVVRKGCWPLSPYSTWFLFYLAAAGKHLQERSALALLDDLFKRFAEVSVPDNGNLLLSPSDLWSEFLQQELLSSEEFGQQGTITHAYASVFARHGSRLSSDLLKLLRAVVLASKLGLQSSGKDDAVCALAELSGINASQAKNGIQLLQDEYNVLEWDEAFRAFDILGDAVPRTHFIAFLRQRVASSFDEAGKSKLFVSRAAEWCDLLGDLDCDFAEENKITTKEWRYKAVTSNADFIAQQIKIAADRWAGALDVDEARGTIMYTYVTQNRDPLATLKDAEKFLKAAASEAGVTALPILLVVLHDADGLLGQSLAEYAVLQEIGDADSARFGNLVGAHKEKLSRTIRDQVESLLKERRYATGLKEGLERQRLNQAGTEIFQKIYKTPFVFPFDGFSTAKGNAADTCQELTRELLYGKLDYDAVIAKPIKTKNRAITVLMESWGIFDKRGDILKRPKHPVMHSISVKWDDALKEDQRLSLTAAIRTLCRPPYGANIASAGLFLGVFIAPRIETLVIVKNDQQLGIAQWLQTEIFKNKFINMSAVGNANLMFIGEASSEWELLLDEWEQCSNHLARVGCLERAICLKQKQPIPPLLVYREERLREQAALSAKILESTDDKMDQALSKMQNGFTQRDVALLAWGVGDLKFLSDKMVSEKPLWTESQIEKLQPSIEKGRQAVVQYFPEWLENQAPRSDAPADVGDFKHKMIKVVGANIKKLGLDNELEVLETYTLQIVKKAEQIAEAQQLHRDVQSWITAHGDAVRIGRVFEIKTLKQVGADFLKKLQSMQQRVQLPAIAQDRALLSEFIVKLKKAEEAITKRLSELCNSKIKSEGDIDRTLSEVESLVSLFDNLPIDLEDLQSMRKALRLYRTYYPRLSDDGLTWSKFRQLSDQLKAEFSDAMQDDEAPWSPEEVIDSFVDIISKTRDTKSLTWITEFAAEAAGIDVMTAPEVNQLYKLLKNFPSYLNDVHVNQLESISSIITSRLDDLSIEWLLEKFKELTLQSRENFIILASQVMQERPDGAHLDID